MLAQSDRGGPLARTPLAVTLKSHQGVVLLLTVTVGVIWFYPWIEAHRFAGYTYGSGPELHVTSDTDSGRGSLREAIFRALRADGPTVIVIDLAELNARAPLPPIISRFGITIRAQNEVASIDASGIRGAPLFDLRSGVVVLSDVEIHSASGPAVLVSGNGHAIFRQVRVADSDVGIAAVEDFRIEISQSEFVNNRIGVELRGGGTGSIQGSTFEANSEAGLWVAGRSGAAVDGLSVAVMSNRIDGGLYGTVLVNVVARLEDNEVFDAAQDGIFAYGGVISASRNQVSNARSVGIRVVGSASNAISVNDVHDNTAAGILVQAAETVNVEDNHLYRNGYGIATVLNPGRAGVRLINNLVVAQHVDGLVIIGDSPVVSGNRALENRSAGIRLLNVARQDDYIEAAPLLTANVLEGNGQDDPVVSEYFERPTGRSR